MWSGFWSGFLEWRFGVTSDGSDHKISGKIIMLHIFRAKISSKGAKSDLW